VVAIAHSAIELTSVATNPQLSEVGARGIRRRANTDVIRHPEVWNCRWLGPRLAHGETNNPAQQTRAQLAGE
jgi:hypothetical protein